MNLKKFATWICAVMCAAVLSACGGSSSDGTASLRVLNATHDYGALDFYSSDTLTLSGIAEGTASSYLDYTEGSYSFKLKPAGTSTTALSNTLSLGKDTSYTLVAYSNGSSLSTTYFTDTQAAPTSGTAAVRIFNGATSSGYVDVYFTATDADFSTASPTASSVASASITSYVELTRGTYRVRVTGYGDKTDIRLDVPSVTLTDQQITTLMLSGTSGGVLVNALLVNQGGTVTPYKNANARLRVVAAVTGNGTVTASTTDSTIGTTLQAPSVGSYVSTPASLSGLAVAVNGTAVDTSSLALAAGTDATLLVYGDASAPQVKMLVDDNAPATATTNAKIRLVNVLNGLGSTITLNADYVAVADNVAFGATSTPASITASTSMRLEVTTPVRTTALYTATDVSLAAGKVYTMFLMGDSSAPVAVLRKDR